MFRMPCRKVAIVAVAVLVLSLSVVALPACQAAPGKPAFVPDSLRIGTGSVGGAMNVWNSVLAKLIEQRWGIPVTAEITAGSSENIRLIDQGQIQLAGASAITLLNAWQGKPPFKKEYTNLRVLAPIYPALNHFFTMPNTGITSIQDFKGKRVGTGSSKFWDIWIKPILTYQGLDYDKDIDRVYAGMSEMYTMVADGRLDAAVHPLAGTVALPGFLKIAAEHKLVYVTFDEAGLKRMEAEHPILSKKMLSREFAMQSFGLDKEVPAIDAGSIGLNTTTAMSDELAYEVVKLLHENLAALNNETKYFDYALKHSEQLTAQFGVPYHPGAIKYWQEVGLWPK